MKQRCFDIKCKDYPNYGGRGIKINQEWMEFKALYAWAKESGYQNNLTIERINNDGDYEPDNCTWIPSEKQARNRRSNHYLDFNGQNKTIIEWSEILNVDRGAIEQRLRRGWSIEKTLTTPIKSREAV